MKDPRFPYEQTFRFLFGQIDQLKKRLALLEKQLKQKRPIRGVKEKK